MVTAETAVILPFLVLIALLLLWIVGLGVTQVRLTDASQQAARMVARGESHGTAKDEAQAIAGDDADVSVRTEHGYVTVTVHTQAHPPLVTSVGSQSMSAETVASLEHQSAGDNP